HDRPVRAERGRDGATASAGSDATHRFVPARQDQRGTGMSTAVTTCATLLARSEDDPQAREELHRQRRWALIPLAAAAALLGLWMVAAPLSGAIIAAGKLKVDL